MLKYFLIIGFLFINNCKAQKMTEVSIQLDTPIEEKALFDQNEFKEKFEKPIDQNTLILKNAKIPFTGPLSVLFPGGEKFADYSYVNGQQEGKQTIFYKNGNLHTQLSIHQGKYDDEYKMYYNDGKIKSLGVYKNGIQISLTSYTEKGTKSSEYVNNEKGVKQEERTYYNSGALLSHRIFSKEEIKVINYYENNVKKSEGTESKKGKLSFVLPKDGEWIYYHENGVVKEQGQWGIGGRHGKDNIKMGVWKVYNEEGTLIEEQKYNNLGARIK